MCVSVPVLAVLDALAQRGSLSQRRVPTASSGQDAILKGERKKRNSIFKESSLNRIPFNKYIFALNYKIILFSCLFICCQNYNHVRPTRVGTRDVVL